MMPAHSPRRPVAAGAGFLGAGIVAIALGLGPSAAGQGSSALWCDDKRVDDVGWPSGFIENAGQWDTEAAFVARLGAMIVRAEPGAVLLQHQGVSGDGQRRGSLLRLVFEGAAGEPDARASGEPLAGVSHFLLGDQPARWRTDVRRFSTVDLGEPYLGVVAQLALKDGAVAIRLTFHPGSDLETVRLGVDGAKAIEVADGGTGDLVLLTDVGRVKLRPQRVGATYSDALSAAGAPSFRMVSDRVAALDRPGVAASSAISVDLQLEWSSYLGGELGGEYIDALALDAQERPIVVGETRSMDFPTTPGAFDESWNGGFGGDFATDIFVTCMQGDGSALVFSTFLGGSSNDHPEVLAVDSDGNVVLAGSAVSPDYPTTPGALNSINVFGDGFVTKLAPDGSSLIASTFLGGSDLDDIVDMALLPDGRIAVTGATHSVDFPVTAGAFDVSLGAQSSDAFIAILDARASTVDYASYVGGSTSDRGYGLARLPSGALAISGTTSSLDFPITSGAYDTTFNGTSNGFVFVLDVDRSVPVYSTFVPCPGYEVAAHSDGSVIVAGVTNSASFPATPGALQPTYAGSQDGCVLRLDPTGGALIYATYLGGSHLEWIRDLAVDPGGRATVVGSTRSFGFPTTPGCLLPDKPPPVTLLEDYFVSRLDVGGTRLLYSTYLGGTLSEAEAAAALALDGEGAAIVGGSSAGDFPVTPGAYDPGEPVIFDATVSKLTMLPTGVLRYGASTPGALGPLAIGVTAMPALGETGFGLTCVAAPPSSSGVLLLALAPLAEPLPAKGIELWVDPSRLLLLIPVASNADGYSELPLVIPNQPLLVGLPT
ncbi:MAG TPA: hypothetical protein VFD43_12255, partial [Planctomycetota bacterium]|nr:hypothetical protein [Planctomycetota bacterium]